jgi:hypothetical protein
METIKERHKNAWEAWIYSMQRIDTLIITICGAGIYVVLESLKNFTEHPLTIMWLVKSSGLLFLTAIIVNFVSQYTGKKANHYEYCWCVKKLESGETPTEIQLGSLHKLDCLADIYSKWTDSLNIISMIFMFGGLITIMIFFLINF